MHFDLRALSIVFVAATAALAACSSSTTSSGSSSGGNTTPVSSADCQSRCVKKLTTCSSMGDPASECSGAVCNTSPVESQVECLEGLDCSSLDGSKSFTQLCPAPSTGSSSGSSGQSSSGSSGSSTSFTCNGQTCDSSTQFCSQVPDSTSDSGFKDDSCKTIPDKCKGDGDDTICQCLQTALDCPTGTSSMHCGFNNNAISFGCD